MASSASQKCDLGVAGRSVSGTVSAVTLRLLLLVLLFPLVLLPSGCASSETEDEYSTFQTAPETADDSHGWGTSISSVGGRK
jgi:hypothetical protein